MNRLLVTLVLLLFAAPVAVADLPRPKPRPPTSPPPPPPPPPSAVIAGTAAAAGLILGGLWLARRTRLQPPPRAAHP